MTELTTQQAYRKIREYFDRSDAVLARENGICKYRTETGDKCAVGSLIPDELYDRLPKEVIDCDKNDEPSAFMSVIENETVINLVGTDDELDAIINGDSEEGKKKLAFLATAQILHDRKAEDASDFVRLLDSAALGAGLRVYGLNG